MDPNFIVSVIAAALNNLASEAVKDAYIVTKQALKRNLGSAEIMDEMETAPGSQEHQMRLAEAVSAHKAAADPELMQAIQQLKSMLDKIQAAPKSMGQESAPPTAFISYSNKDEAFAVNLYRRLTRDGIPCWFDKESIAWGANWVCALEEGLDACADLILILTPDWCRSEWTRLEQSSIRAEDPAGLRKKIRPLLLKPCPDQMPRFLRPLQAIDVSTPERFEAAYPRIRNALGNAVPSPHHPDLEPLIQAYGKKAASLHEHLPLMGFRTRLRVPIRIEDIYVPLRAMVDRRASGDACFADAEDAEKKLGRSGECDDISLPQAFARAEEKERRGIVILGDPGSGKTTHLKRVLLWCLQGHDQECKLAGDMISVFLPLRELTDLNSGLDAFIQAQLDKPHLDTPLGFGRRLLEHGNLLLLLDGLDEVADSDQRAKVARWIDEAMIIHDTCRFVVTCRFAGYTEKSRLSEQFLEMHIRPLDFDQVKAFVNSWYRIVETSLAKDAIQARVIAEERAEKLIEIFETPEFRARRVFEMTRNPLLLTNICLVHRDRGNLPKSRVGLYEECTDVLLELWRAAIGYDVKVNAKTGKKVLQPAALWLHEKEGRTRATADELAPVIEPALQNVGWPHGDAEAFLNLVRDESGLLTGWDQEHYGFMHLGFQEYLAARQIQNNYHKDPNILNALVANFGQSWWQEVILLLLALDNPCLFEPFMQILVHQMAFIWHPDLVEMCLDDAAERPLRPFLELLQVAPGKDPVHWQCQLAALKLVERLDNKALNSIVAQLADHPFEQIRERVGQRREKATQKVIHAPKGGYELVWIPGGEFLMGSPDSEKRRSEYEGPQHKVQVPGFYMGRYPVTNEEYARYLSDTPKAPEPEYWADRNYNQPRQPVVGVSWEDARQYALWAGLQFPSEAQWEYACRAGTRTRYYTGDTEQDLDRAGWCGKNAEYKLHPVGEKEPNAFGLYDMHGNVWEWVADDWHRDYNKAPDEGSVWIDDPRGSSRVVRGGGWSNSAGGCRAASRRRFEPGLRDILLGIRLALPSGQPGQ